MSSSLLYSVTGKDLADKEHLSGPLRRVSKPVVTFGSISARSGNSKSKILRCTRIKAIGLTICRMNGGERVNYEKIPPTLFSYPSASSCTFYEILDNNVSKGTFALVLTLLELFLVFPHHSLSWLLDSDRCINKIPMC